MRSLSLLAVLVVALGSFACGPTPCAGASCDGGTPSDGGLVYVGGWAALDGGWEVTQLPTVDGGIGYVDRVNGTGPNDVWVVGESNPGLHWDGSRWDVVDRDPRFPNVLTCVLARTATDVWVSGYGGNTNAMHWNGSTWTASPLPTPSNCSAISGTASNNLWTSSGAHWDGASWQATPGADTSLRGVWVSPTVTWVVGDGATAASGVARVWNGSVWSNHAIAKGLYSVWGASDSDAWAVGEAGQISHWNGTQWTTQSPPAGVSGKLRAVHGSSATNVWAAGVDGALHWDGSAWTLYRWPGGAFDGEKSVWVDGAGMVWFATGGQVLRRHE